jgi:hypothetical protein
MASTGELSYDFRESLRRWWDGFWVSVPQREFGLYVAASALLIIACYVFLFSPYLKFIYSDMARYWHSALDRLNGHEYSDAQFIAWPPLYHIFLAELFRLFRALGLEGMVRIETALTINMLVFAVSVYAFHRLAVRWFERPAFILVAVLLYAFGFPALYFNAFLLADNLGAPLLVIAVAVLATREGWRATIIAALLFGLATAVRPSFGPYGLAFMAFYLARHRLTWPFVKHAALFSAAFFTIVLLGSAEVARISKGKVFGLSANGGLDFFIAHTDYHKVDVSYHGWHFFVVVPGYSFKPENGAFYTNVPFYRQDYYFKLGWEAFKRDPDQVWKNVRFVRNLFFAPMLPTRTDAPGFSVLMPTWDWLKFGMFLVLGLYFWASAALGTQRPMMWLMISLIGLTAIVSYFFTGEPRYTYSLMFAFYLLSLRLIELMAKNWRAWLKPLGWYAVALAVAGTATAAVLKDPYYPPTINVTVDTEPNGTPQPVATEHETGRYRASIGRALFPYAEGGRLDHVRQHLPLVEPARVQLRTLAHVSDADGVPVKFETYSAWPFEVRINGEEHIPFTYPLGYFDEFVSHATLGPGTHEIEVVFHYEPAAGGFAVAYSYWDGDWPQRQLLGVSSKKIRFTPVE